MADQAIGFSLAVITVSVLWAGAAAQLQSGTSCSNALISMSPCLNYITGNSSKPTSGCCAQLANVVQSQPQCLCEALSGGSSSALGFTVNQTQALALPGACSVQTPSSNHCNVASPTGSSSGAPATSTGSSSGTPPTSNTVSPGTGSKSGPSTDSISSSSDASSKKITVSLLFILLFIASYVSTFTIC